MPVRRRNNKWEYRFWIAGKEYSKVLDLAGTERNRTAATRIEAEARKTVMEGKAHLLKLEIKSFTEAVAAFLAWAEGEHREHPNTVARLKVSFTSLKAFFGNSPVSSITEGQVDDFKSWRRTVHVVRDVTIRHDLHALSPFFEYAIRHNWARANPVKKVAIPSDAESVRMHVLTAAEEKAYFDRCLEKKYFDLHDHGRLMIQQGCRPEELRELKQADVDLEAGRLTIRKGKSHAARRTLKLTAESREILTRRLQNRNLWVFPSPVCPGRHIGNLPGTHNKVIEDAKLSFVPYDLRHTFATRAAERGMPIPTLAAVLGHANLRSVMKYVHVSQEHMDSEMARLNTTVIERPVSTLRSKRKTPRAKAR
jgi:integrase